MGIRCSTSHVGGESTAGDYDVDFIPQASSRDGTQVLLGSNSTVAWF